ncbi:unnamed protein product, partial [marine sediment metagenome]
ILLEELVSLDLRLLSSLQKYLPEKEISPSLSPIPYLSHDDIIKMEKERELGRELISGGKAAFLTVAGGQGSRLGFKGLVIVKPDKRVLKKYYNTLAEWHKHELQLLNLNELPAETRDGKLISLEANIEIPEEVESVIAHGADGIGLYRSEFLFIRPNRFPTEEEQFQAYRSVLESLKGKSVTIRSLDLGGDKVIPGFNGINESNPILGWRAVRFCLSRPDIFKAQLRAMLRSSVYGNLKIMFPMISGIEELESILALLEETKDELTRR